MAAGNIKCVRTGGGARRNNRVVYGFNCFEKVSCKDFEFEGKDFTDL